MVIRRFAPGVGMGIWCWVLGIGMWTETQSIAQLDPIKEEIVAIRARTIETASKGTIRDGIILIRNGKITSVGKDVKIPVGARVIAADTVIPGIVGAYSQIGLSAAAAGPPIQLPRNIPPQFAGRFDGGAARSGSNPHYRVLDELYPFDEQYARLLRAGVTTLGLVPDGRGVPGQGAIIKPIGETPEKMVLQQTSPLSIGFQQETQTQDLIRSTLQGGGANMGGPAGGRAGFGGRRGGRSPDEEGGDDFQRGQRRTTPAAGGFTQNAAAQFTLQARQAPITRAVGGEVPTFISCTDATAMTYALNLFQPFDKLKPVYILSADCYRIADVLGPKNISAILTADLSFEPNTRNRVNSTAILSKAGVKVACRPSSDSVQGYEGLLAKMGELIKSGLDVETALKAITLHPAEMLGVQDRVGGIEPGRDANLVILDGDPFSPLTKVTRVLLEGKTVYDGR